MTARASWLAGLLVAAGACSGGKAQVDGVSAGYTKIDDMEEGGDRTEWASPGLTTGLWWTATDCPEYDNISPAWTGANPSDWSFAVIPAPHETFPGVVSKNAARLRTTAPLTGVWGAEMGFELGEVPGSDAGTSGVIAPDGGGVDDAARCSFVLDWKASTVDIGAYSGITFWAMADPAGAQNIRVQLSDRNTDPRGGVCNAGDPASVADCFNLFSTPVMLTDTFARYTIDFSSLQQAQTWGYRPDPDVPDLQHTFEISFAVDLPTCAASATSMCAGGADGPPSVSFDFWIDDLYFVDK